MCVKKSFASVRATCVYGGGRDGSSEFCSSLPFPQTPAIIGRDLLGRDVLNLNRRFYNVTIVKMMCAYSEFSAPTCVHACAFYFSNYPKEKIKITSSGSRILCDAQHATSAPYCYVYTPAFANDEGNINCWT